MRGSPLPSHIHLTIQGHPSVQLVRLREILLRSVQHTPKLILFCTTHNGKSPFHSFPSRLVAARSNTLHFLSSPSLIEVKQPCGSHSLQRSSGRRDATDLYGSIATLIFLLWNPDAERGRAFQKDKTGILDSVCRWSVLREPPADVKAEALNCRQWFFWLMRVGYLTFLLLVFLQRVLFGSRKPSRFYSSSYC